ncbi:TOMM precursor leader peptide-binding protein [Humibacter antri]
MSDSRTKWSIDPRVVLRVVPGDGVYALRGDEVTLLGGSVYEAVAPLIDGTRDSNDLVDELTGRSSAAEVYFAIQSLHRRGMLVPSAPPTRLAEAAWWDDMGASAEAPAAVERRRVGIYATSDVPESTVAAAEAGLKSADATVVDAGRGDFTGLEADLLLVLAGDGTTPELADVNRYALAAGMPWLLVQPAGRRVLLGPLFRPGASPCWECMMVRRRSLRRVHAYLSSLPDAVPVTMPVVTRPDASELAGRVAAMEVVKILGGVRQPRVEDAPTDSATLTELDITDWSAARHVVVRRPQCLVCGDPAPAPLVPVRPVPERANAQDDGGSRTVSPMSTYRRYRHHVSSITGAVSRLQPGPMPDPEMHLWYSGTNVGLPPNSLFQLRRTLRAGAAGKGTTAEQARAGALAEALERYSGMATGEERRVRASLRDLGDAGIDPNHCMLYSEAQFVGADAINALGSWFNSVPRRFDPDAAIDWTSLWSLTEDREVFLPTTYCYYGGWRAPGDNVFADSNGCAAGNTLTEAILQGALELIERDAVALWWYNRLRRPAVDLHGIGDPWVDRLVDTYHERGRDVWALDITTDLGIPVIAALSRRTDAPTERITMGFGAHLDGKIAVLRALAELNQLAPIGDGPEVRDAGVDREVESWMRNATVANQPYLLPDAAAPLWRLADHPSLAGADLAADVTLCRQRVEAAGMAMHVLDQTRPDIGLPVARVVVPGIRPFWSRFAPGRLYDVPVRLGWLDSPTPEADLNPIGIFW